MKYKQLLASGITAAVLLVAPVFGASSDNSFVTKAAAGGAAEVHMAQLAQTKASSQHVKDLASKIQADHTKANDTLKPIATKDNVTWPSGMDAKEQAEYNKLQALSGAEFDKEYVNYEIKEHKQDIRAFQHEVDHGTDSQVKAWASENLPVLQEHLRMAQSALGSLH
jgi:putative membrane protein